MSAVWYRPGQCGTTADRAGMPEAALLRDIPVAFHNDDFVSGCRQKTGGAHARNTSANHRNLLVSHLSNLYGERRIDAGLTAVERSWSEVFMSDRRPQPRSLVLECIIFFRQREISSQRLEQGNAVQTLFAKGLLSGRHHTAAQAETPRWRAAFLRFFRRDFLDAKRACPKSTVVVRVVFRGFGGAILRKVIGPIGGGLVQL